MALGACPALDAGYQDKKNNFLQGRVSRQKEQFPARTCIKTKRTISCKDVYQDKKNNFLQGRVSRQK
ncbi:MAG: hypothetical protein J0M18_07755, partial [Ignavibacteria bacterium]|nr:hypothetical protein [Ignavibacteria bacterium]